MINSVKRNSKLMYTVSEVSVILNLSEQTVRKMMKNNELRYIKIGNNYRITQKELNRIMKTDQE